VDVIETDGEERVRVVFIDFGNSEWIRPRQMRTLIHPALLELPQISYEIRLKTIRPKGEFVGGGIKSLHKSICGKLVSLPFALWPI
jgi:hypothetical protein